MKYSTPIVKGDINNMDMTIEQLKTLADKLNFSYHHLIGAEKLKTLLTEHCVTLGVTLEDAMKEDFVVPVNKTKEEDMPVESTKEEVKVKTPTKETSSVDKELEALRNLTFADADKVKMEREEHDVYKKALKLIRCNVICNNPNKKSYSGEIFCARNKSIPEVKKFIQFNTPTHIPQILYNMLKEKKVQLFKKTRVKGVDVTTPYLANEYTIEVLPSLTPEEFEAIRQKQLAEGK